jgi:hypothetical protein
MSISTTLVPSIDSIADSQYHKNAETHYLGNLDKVLLELEEKDLPAYQNLGVKASIYYAFDQYEKAEEATRAYFQYDIETLNSTQAATEALKSAIETLQFAIKDPDLTLEKKHQLQSQLKNVVQAISAGPCNKCPRNTGGLGYWVYSSYFGWVCLC